MSGRRPMTMRQAVETLLRAGQLRLEVTYADGEKMVVDVPWSYEGANGDTERVRPILYCVRSSKEIDLSNVGTLQAEHWPERHKHGGPVDPKNALLSLSEGHKVQTKREQKADRKERRVKAKALPKAEREVPVHKRRYRWKKKLDGSVVRVRTR